MKFTEQMYVDRMLQLGINVGRYRRLRGMSQLELAEAVDADRTTIGKIEAQGTVGSFSLRMLFKIAAALDIEPALLFEYKDLDKK